MVPDPIPRIGPAQYEGEEQDMGHVQALVDPELSEPYSIFTYRSAYRLSVQRSCVFARRRHMSPLIPNQAVLCSQWAPALL